MNNPAGKTAVRSAVWPESQIRLVADSVPAMIAFWDADLVCRFSNLAYRDLYGLSPADMLGMQMQDLLGEQLFALNGPHIAAALSGVEQRFERALQDTDGATRHTQVDYIPSTLGSEAGGFTSVVTDVSGIKRAELALAQANAQLLERAAQAEQTAQTKTAFLANMSHEIRTPMNAIIGLGRLLRRDVTDPVPHQRLLQLDAAAQHLLRVINDILDLSKAEAGKLTVQRLPLSLDDVLARAADMVRPAAAAKGLALTVAPAPWTGPVLGDATRLTQALLNLLTNAVKFTPTGWVRLQAHVMAQHADGCQLRFEVQDSGPGLTPAAQALLFQRFVQLENGSANPPAGSGLGLALTREFAALMGGEAGVDSAPGQGSTFWFTARFERGVDAAAAVSAPTPAHADAAQGAEAAEAAEADEAADTADADEAAEATLRRLHAGQRVLLVEDDPINQEVMVELLESVGLVVETAEDGLQAVAMAAARPYALLLMDMRMPRLDGLGATREIRRQQRLALPILAVSANAFADDRAACLAAGMNDHLAKPVDPDVLYRLLQQWLPPAPAPGTPCPPAPVGPAVPRAPAEPPAALPERLARIAGLNLAQGLAITRGDLRKLLKILRSFVRYYGAGNAGLISAAAGVDRAAVQAAAHSIRGACASVGVAGAAGLAQALEATAAAAPAAALHADAQRLHAELQRVAADIALELDRPS